MTHPNIVIIGHVCIDHNTTENATYTNWGSTVLYIAQYFQQAHNITPTVISAYGPDMTPYATHFTLLPKEPNRTSTLIYENDTRQIPRIWRAHNTTAATAPELTPELSEAIAQADIVIVGTLLPNYSVEYIRELLSHAKPDSLKVLCPQGYFRTVSDNGLVVPRDFTEGPQIIPLFDLVIYSEEDHPRAFAVASEWASYTNHTHIIVTEGPMGASIVTANKPIHIPTVPLSPDEIVDSVGCGDVFDATVTYSYYVHKDLDRAIRDAHKAAAAKLLAIPAQ